MSRDDAPQHNQDHQATLAERSIITEGPLGSWFTVQNVIFGLNEVHGNFRRVFFDRFRALLEEPNHEAYVRRMADYVRLIQSKYMFVRVERPYGSKRFVMGYVKCDWVFSFALRFEQMRLRLSCISPVVLMKVEHGENKVLRLACVGETDYERALAKHRLNGQPPLLAALEAGDEESAMILLDGGDDPNKVDGNGRNALRIAAEEGCRPPLFRRILDMTQDVNAGNENGDTALIHAARGSHLDVVISLMNHPGIDLNVQGWMNFTALHAAHDNPAMLAQLLSDDRADCGLKGGYFNWTPLQLAIFKEEQECVKILREHGAPDW
jgi:ankyrin repeat protein